MSMLGNLSKPNLKDYYKLHIMYQNVDCFRYLCIL